MNELEKLLAQLTDVDAKLDALLAHDDLDEAQRAEHDRLTAERKKVTAAVGRERDRQAREEERLKLEADAAEAKVRKDAAEKRKNRTVSGGPLTDRDPPPAGAAAGRGASAAEIFLPTGRLKIPATAKRFGQPRNFRGNRGGFGAEERAYRFGMWAMAALVHQMPNRFGHLNGAVDWVDRYMASVAPNDASGYHHLIPEEFSSDIIDLREQFGVARQVLRVVPMMSETKRIPRREGGLTAYAVGPNGAITESNKTWDEIELTARTWAVISRASKDVREDLAISWGDDLAGEIAYAFAEKEDDCAFNGDGTSTYHGIRGIRTRLQDVDGAGTDGYGLVTGAGNAWSELVLADFDKVVGRLPQYADTPMAVWVMHRTFYYEVVEKLVQAAGGVPAYEIREGRRTRPLFKGYPVEFSQKFPASEANSSVVCTLGDHGKGAVLGDRQGMEVEFSDQAYVNGQSLWERHQVAIKGTERYDINVHDVGTASVAGPIVGLQTASS